MPAKVFVLLHRWMCSQQRLPRGSFKHKIKSNPKLGMEVPGRMFTRKQPDKQGTLVSCKEVELYSVATIPSLSEPHSGSSPLGLATGASFLQAASGS